MTNQNETRHRGNGDGLRASVSLAGNSRNNTPSLTPSQHKALVEALGDAIEALISVLDALEGDPDLEDGFDLEPEDGT